MNLDKWSRIFVSVCIILVLTACYLIVTAYLSENIEPFFALAVLGEEGMAEHYFPDDDPNIKVGEEVHWFLYLYNHMGEAKYVAVMMKLLNSTMLAPNSTSCSPSTANLVFEVKHVLLDNETWLYPFNWSLLEVNEERESISIERLMINGEVFQIDVDAFHDYSFRVVLELWLYDESSEDFIFGWSSGKELHCAWNQIWFNATSIK
jgi:hypothetical protein